jgi:hypothetical protein
MPGGHFWPIPPALITVGGLGGEARSKEYYAPAALGVKESHKVAGRRNNERDPATGVLDKGNPWLRTAEPR